MKAEYGKYYLLNPNNSYFSVSLQRSVKFDGLVAVKCDSGFGEDAHFGYLINTENPNGPDYETKSEIEFNDSDIIEEYQLKDMKLIYYDFKNLIKYLL